MATVRLHIPLRSQCLDGKRRHYSRWEAEEHLKSLRLWDKANRPAAAPTDVAAPAGPKPDVPDLRLVIEEDATSGSFVYKTIDRRTGEVVLQLPREDVLKLREADAYSAGDVIKTQV